MNKKTKLFSALSLFTLYASVSYAANPVTIEYLDKAITDLDNTITELREEIPNYTIGQSAEGGVIFFVFRDSVSNEKKALVAQSSNLSDLDWNAAKAACEGSAANGYSDWVLPNRQQITALFNNRYAVGGLNVGEKYWTNNDSGSNATFQNFESAALGTEAKTSINKVRCIRIIPA